MSATARRRAKAILWLSLCAVAAARAWVFRNDLVNDTVSYLEMGELFFQGHPSAIVNGTWGPLYALILGGWLKLLGVSPAWEYPAIHVLLLLVFVLTLVAFEFFLRGLIAFKAHLEGGHDDASTATVTGAITLVAYVLFAWAALDLIGVEETNPDMLVAAFFFVACGCVLRLQMTPTRLDLAVGLGAAVGLGYLTKAAMLPIGLVLVVAGTLSPGARRARLRRGAVVAAIAAVLVAPQVAALSTKLGHFATSDTGRFNYAVLVQGVTYRHWQGEEPGAGHPLHPTRKLSDAPAVFEFDGPLPGTYPPWFDPSYWYAGVKPVFNLRKQLHAIRYNGRSVLHLFGALNGAPLVLCLLLLGLTLRRADARAVLPSAARMGLIAAPAALALVPYVLVHYESRYLGGFLCVLFLAVLAGARPLLTPRTLRLYTTGAVVVGAMLFVPLTREATLRALLRRPPSVGAEYWHAAQALDGAGFGPGTKVATLEYANMSSVLWARLARVKVVAEVYYRPDREETDRNLFWNASSDGQERALEALRRAGARVVVTAERPRGPTQARWRPLADTRYSYLEL